MKILFLCLLLSSFSTAFSQSVLSKTIRVFAFINDNQALRFSPADKVNRNVGIGLSYEQRLQPKLSTSLSIAGSFTDSAIKKLVRYSEKKFFLETDVSVRYDLLDVNYRVQPFLLSGLGLSYCSKQIGVYAPVGLGSRVILNHDIQLVTQLQYRFGINSHAIDRTFYSLGIAGKLPTRKKAKPKITHASFKSMRTYDKKVLDRDQDGIVDSIDSCPDIPGLALFNGCPDSDQDGIPDREDQCPWMFGFDRYHGCPIPDRDGDGINDEEDQCPELVGVLKYFGCPVPDSDKDGIHDEEDRCIDVPGVKERDGCPLVYDTLQTIIAKAARNIQFETGSHIIKQRSIAALDSIVTMLHDHVSLRVLIEGHTDNTGDENQNRLLSERRAQTVLSYLVQYGIEKSRLSAIGHGQTQPVTSNGSRAGRAINRRVEFKLY